MAYSFGGPKPTHMVLAGPDATDQQVAQVRDMIEHSGFPVVLPAGWQVQSIEPVGFVVPYTEPHNVAPLPEFVAVLLLGMIIGAAIVVFVLMLGGKF